MMNTKTAREAFTKLEQLLGEYAGEIMTADLEAAIWAAESAQEDVDAITDEERANLQEDEEFTAEAELEEALAKVETAFEEVIGAIEAQREKLLEAEHFINVAFGVEDGYEEEAEAA